MTDKPPQPVDENQIIAERRAKLTELRRSGAAFPNDFAREQLAGDLHAAYGATDKEKLESARWVERVTKAYASMFTSFVAHANRAGNEDGLSFWGGATVFDPNGEELAHGPYFEEALTFADLDLNQLRRTRARLPLLRDERTSLVQKELERILARENGR